MKSVRTVNGVTWIDDAVQKSEQLNDKLLEILNAHRDTLIKRILANLEVYLLYRFEVKAPKEKLIYIKDKLISMKNYNVDMTKHARTFTEANVKDQVYIGTQAFYDEIDEQIGWGLV
jgi:hypothetical protein